MIIYCLVHRVSINSKELTITKLVTELASCPAIINKVFHGDNTFQLKDLLCDC
jgi:hypothetical protein